MRGKKVGILVVGELSSVAEAWMDNACSQGGQSILEGAFLHEDVCLDVAAGIAGGEDVKGVAFQIVGLQARLKLADNVLVNVEELNVISGSGCGPDILLAVQHNVGEATVVIRHASLLVAGTAD